MYVYYVCINIVKSSLKMAISSMMVINQEWRTFFDLCVS